MKILLTGATGYIGQRLLPLLLDAGHEVVCLVRDPRRFEPPARLGERATVAQGDLLRPESLAELPTDIDAAYYLVHSMSGHNTDFFRAEQQSAQHFVAYLNRTNARQVVYLSGIANDRALSTHLRSRRAVEKVLGKATAQLTVLRASIVIGSGSASFEIIRDLVEKLPVMVTPRWLRSRCQPIGVRDVMFYPHGRTRQPRLPGPRFRHRRPRRADLPADVAGPGPRARLPARDSDGARAHAPALVVVAVSGDEHYLLAGPKPGREPAQRHRSRP